MISALVVSALAAVPRLAAPGLTCAEIPPETCRAFSEHLVQQLTARGLQVVSAEDIATVLGHERQKQLLGCADDNASCTAEIAGALGVETIVRGSVAAVRETILVNVRVVDATSAKPLASFSESVQGIDQVPPALERAGAQISGTLAPQAGGAARANRLPAVAAGAIAVACAVGGAISLGIASGASSEVRNKMNATSDYDVDAALGRGRSAATAGYALLGVAVVAAAAAAVLFVLFGSSPSGSTHVALAADAHGGFAVLAGSWP